MSSLLQRTGRIFQKISFSVERSGVSDTSADYFEGAFAEDDGRSNEVPSLTVARMYRCLWLGIRLALACFSLHLI